MTTETVETTSDVGAASVPFNIEVGRTELAQLRESYVAKTAELVAAGATADVAKMQTLGAEMAKIAVAADRLEKRIKRAETGGANSDLDTKIAARKGAFDALTNFFLTDESNPVRVLLQHAPTVKMIRIKVENGMIQGFDTVGGFREVKVRGTKRPRARWVGGSITSEDGLSTKEVVIQYGGKYGVTKAYADLTSSERNAAAVAIAAGESFTNKNAKPVEAE